MATVLHVREIAFCPSLHLTYIHFNFSGLLFGIPTSPPSTYLTLSFRNLGFSTIHSNLLTIPSQVGTMITMAAITLISENVNDRAWVAMSEDVWALPFLIALRTLPAQTNPWKFYVGFLIYQKPHKF